MWAESVTACCSRKIWLSLEILLIRFLTLTTTQPPVRLTTQSWPAPRKPGQRRFPIGRTCMAPLPLVPAASLVVHLASLDLPPRRRTCSISCRADLSTTKPPSSKSSTAWAEPRAFPGCITLGGATQTTPQYFASQFASIYAWRSIGNSAYNAGQVLLRHAMSHGLQFDLNYTYSHSIDVGSDAERIGDLGGPGDQIYNAWSPRLQRATSTFDTTHQINSNWVYEFPFGRGRAFGQADRAASGEHRSGRLESHRCLPLDQRLPVQRWQWRGMGDELGSVRLRYPNLDLRPWPPGRRL